MKIRTANFKDAPAIKFLLNASGHQTTISLLVDEIETGFGKDNNELYVYELQKDIITGFAVVHYFPQLLSAEKHAFVSLFIIEEPAQNLQVAQTLEEYVIKEASKRQCNGIKIINYDKQLLDTKFYLQQGYQPGYDVFTKSF